MLKPDRLGWPLIGAAALSAMVSGHAVELWLENLHLFGEGRANYTHPVQTFALEAAALLFGAVALAIGWRIFQCALSKRTAPLANLSLANRGRSDCLLPALSSIAHLGLAWVCVALVAVQFASLIAAELLEQRLAGFSGGLGAIIGPEHASAIVVHLVVGFIFAFALQRTAQYVCGATRNLVGALATFLRRSRVSLHAAVDALLRFANFAASDSKPPLLSLGIANRPPPVALVPSA